MVTVKAGALADLVRDILASAGCSAAEPERIGKEGVPLPDDTWASIVAAARDVGVDERHIQEAGAA
jgi:hypothetical protein